MGFGNLFVEEAEALEEQNRNALSMTQSGWYVTLSCCGVEWVENICPWLFPITVSSYALQTLCLINLWAKG